MTEATREEMLALASRLDEASSLEISVYAPLRNEHSKGYLDESEVAAIVAALRSAATPDARAETIEECAKIAHDRRQKHNQTLIANQIHRDTRDIVVTRESEAQTIEQAIRALAKDTPADGGGESSRSEAAAHAPFRDKALAGRERQISADEAQEIALRLIAGSFGEHQNPNKRPRFSIPCRPWDDDDCLIIEYIKQTAAALSASSARVEVLEAALEPFAKVAQHISPQCPADYSLMQMHDLTAKHFRNASDVLSKPSTEGKEEPELFEQLRPIKPGQPDFRIDIVDTKLKVVPPAVARAYWLAKIDREFPL